jgi:hypothetical protein
MELLHQYFIPILVVSGMLIGVLILALVLVLRHKITDVQVSREGFHLYTNSGGVVFEVMSNCESYDSAARKAIRKATSRLTLLPPEKYGLSAEVMLINEKANQPLIDAAYENHHTRELDAEGSEGYLADKVQDIAENIRDWRKQFPDLTDDMIDSYVRRWAVKIVAPHTRKACREKLAFYHKLYENDDIVESLKKQVKEWIIKNERYVVNFDQLPERLGISSKSCLIPPSGIL